MSVDPATIPGHWVDHAAAELDRPVRKAWLKNVYAFAEVLFATAEGPPSPARLRWLCHQLDDFLSRIGSRARRLFRLSLWVVSVLAPLFAFRLPGLRFWSFATRERALDRMERSLLGATILPVKAILGILWYEHPDVAASVGFDGQPLRSLDQEQGDLDQEQGGLDEEQGSLDEEAS